MCWLLPFGYDREARVLRMRTCRSLGLTSGSTFSFFKCKVFISKSCKKSYNYKIIKKEKKEKEKKVGAIPANI